MRVFVLTLLVLLLAPAGAQAGTLSVERTISRGTGVHGVDEEHSSLRYDAAPGERNVVEARFAGDVLTLSDAAGVTASAPCVAVSPVEARCSNPGGLRILDLALGDQDDRAEMHADGLASMTADGGDGDDHLLVDVDWPNLGGVVSGGPGADVLVAPHGSADGGPGDDRLEAATVTYAGRRGPLVADLAAGTADLPGEHDTLVGGADLVGTNADDTIAGSAEADGIDGGPGDDTLTGGTGDDHLAGWSGADRLDGGDGDDTLDGGYSADVVIGGPGRDDLDGGGGRDRVDARDGTFDEIACASFADGRQLGQATVDAADVVIRCLRVSRLGAPAAVLMWGGSNPVTNQLTNAPLDLGKAAVGCSQDIRGGCHGTIVSTLPDGSGRSRAAHFDVRAGADWPDTAVSVPLAPAAQAIRARCGAVTVRYVLRSRDRRGRVHVSTRDAVEALRPGPPAPDCA